MSVRVRFAPSPTGHLHVGGARTAIYNWVFARHMKGDFIIRFEDTDIARSSREAEDSMLHDMKWIGLQWKEGPDVGGPLGPYRQSERKHIYQEYADRLVAEGLAYPCFCTDELLDQKREAAAAKGAMPQYDGTCRGLSEKQREEKRSQGIPFAIRYIVEGGDHELNDLIRGHVVFKAGMVGDFVVMRSNGLPTYNFACVIDDGLMKISHVIRAEEHLSNTNRQLMLYNTLKFPKPEFAHVSLVMGRDEDGAVSKLSKRHGAASVDQYKEEGFLPAAMINYLTQLGWSHPDGKEVFSLDDLTEKFSIGRIGKSPSIFDIAKLTWMNGVYIKALPDDEFERRVTPFIDESQHHWFLKHPHTYRTDLLRLVKSGLNRLDEINKALEQFVPWKGPHLESDAKEFLVQTPEVKMVLASLHAALTRTPSLESEAVAKALIDQVKAETKTKGKPLMMGIRVGISGQCHGSDLGNLIRFLGREECLRRLQWIQQAF